MICSWCYGNLNPSDHVITTWYDSQLHIDCAQTEVGMGVPRTDREYQIWLGMTGEELDGDDTERYVRDQF